MAQQLGKIHGAAGLLQGVSVNRHRADTVIACLDIIAWPSTKTTAQSKNCDDISTRDSEFEQKIPKVTTAHQHLGQAPMEGIYSKAQMSGDSEN